MATIAAVNVPTGCSVAFVVSWANLANGDVGEAISFAQYTDKSVQVAGVFGTGGSVTFEGSNDGVNWAPLTDPQGNDLAFTAEKIELVTEATLKVRPNVTAGDGATSLTVTVLMKE